MTSSLGTLLVVDDEEMNRDMLSRRLALEGYHVVTASSGREALSLIARQSFDVVLLDVMMPDLNGFEVLAELRKTFLPIALPVIMVTARSQSDDIVAAFEHGANDYITKPIHFPVALARITSQLASKRASTALRESEMRYSLSARGANDGLWDWDLQSNEIYYSPRWKTMLGFSENDISSSPDEWLDRVHPDDLEQVRDRLKSHRAGQSEQFESEHRMLHKDQTYRWVLSRGVAIRDEHGVELRMAGSQTDITRGKGADALTGLANRVLFTDRVTNCLTRAKNEPKYIFAVLFLDLDRFKVVNDSLGHLAGDQLLTTVARRLESCLRNPDSASRSAGICTVARFGGDEFTVLLNDLDQVEDAARVADRILTALGEPISLAGQEVVTSASIGIAIGRADYQQPDDILRDADTAMYCAKSGGKARYVLFELGMRTQAVARLEMEAALRRAMERQEFRLHYQPIVSLASRRIVGFEALLRWQHPERGLVSPVEFIPIAEDTSQIVPLGLWSLREACRKMRTWQKSSEQHRDLFISVNLSCRQFNHPELVEDIANTLRETGLPPHSLKLEITESTVMDDPDAAAILLQQLTDLGVHVGVDDFGTGYSSLSYLQNFSINTLKIDRSFISRMEKSDQSSQLIQSIVSMAHNLKMDVIAEGIELPEQDAWLKQIDCEYGQGFLYSRPVPSETAEALLTDARRFNVAVPLALTHLGDESAAPV